MNKRLCEFPEYRGVKASPYNCLPVERTIRLANAINWFQISFLTFHSILHLDIALLAI